MKIEVKGAIIDDSEQWIYDWFDVPATSAKKVNEALAKANVGEEIELNINSGGGSVFAGSEIYTVLKDYKGKVTGKITGIAGSAASVIAMGADELQISPTGQIMIHNAGGVFGGDYHDMQLGAEILKGINDSIANAYTLKTGKKHSELLQMMDNETWLNAQKALELGFVDKIMFAESPKIFNAVEVDSSGVIPKAIIDKMRNEKGKLFENKVENQVVDTDKMVNNTELAKARLKLQIHL